MPKSTDARRQRCLQWVCRNSPHFTPHASDDEGDPTDENGEDDAAVLGLLELASNRLSVPQVDDVHDEEDDDDDGYGMEEDFDIMQTAAA